MEKPSLIEVHIKSLMMSIGIKVLFKVFMTSFKCCMHNGEINLLLLLHFNLDSKCTEEFLLAPSINTAIES